MQFPELSRAASPEGIALLAVVYFAFALLSKIKKGAQKSARPRPPQDRPVAGADTESASTGFSLEAVLKEIERVKQEAQRRSPPAGDQGRPRHSVAVAKVKPEGNRPRQLPSTERKGRMAKALDEKGPLGRHSRIRLPSSEEFEDRTSLEDGGSIEIAGRLENLDESRRRRVEVDHDNDAEALVQRRIDEAESRNRSFSELDHRQFHEKVKRSESVQASKAAGLTTAQLRQAMVWKEILGPPKALE